MTTRNEWIAERATHAYDQHGAGIAAAIKSATAFADALESANVAPWQTPTTSAESEAVAMIRRFMDPDGGYSVGTFQYDARAYLARLDAAKGGAT